MKFIDYYSVLNLAETASTEEIKKAYRRLARKYHPDVSKAENAEDKFKEVGEAYAVLGNAEKKAEYDELRNYRQSGNEYSIPPEWQHREGDAGFYHSGQEGFSDFFESIFRQSRSQHQSEHVSINGEDINYVLPITLEEAFNGSEREISYNTISYDARGVGFAKENNLKVVIPKRVVPGQLLRLGGKGQPGIGAGNSGDLYLVIEILPHKQFSVEGRDLIQFLPVAPWEIALGEVIPVQTLQGIVRLTIPQNSKPGQKLRVKGKGLGAQPHGDLYVVLQVKFPEVINEQQRDAYRALKKQFDFDPRNIREPAK